VGGTGELIDNGVTGLLVEPRDPLAMARAILLLANDSGLSGRMGLKAQNEVSVKWPIEKSVQAYVRAYQTAIEHHDLRRHN
jgi:glycosyltransferase involved in cell wall biosynthesis